MDWLSDPQIWISLITLTLLEIVLGIDNIIVISVLSGRLPKAEQKTARTLGLSLALITRILLLCTLFWLVRLTEPLLYGLSGKDLVLILGGAFLIAKSTREIHDAMEGREEKSKATGANRMAVIVIEIILLDIVFSLDSVITAVGLVQNIGVMIAAVVLAMLVMLTAAGTISDFVNRYPTIKMLALSFLLLIGVVLVAEGFGQPIHKSYIYFAMAFSVTVELLNIKVRSRRKRVTASR